MSWPVVKLGELLAPAKTVLAGNRDFPLLSMTMHHGLVKPEQKFKKRVASEDVSAYKVVNKGQLVVGFPIDEGVLSFQTIFPQAIVSPAYGIWDLNRRHVSSEYLERYLKSPEAISYYFSKLRSTTARRRSLDRSTFLDMPIPLPPLAEQKRIAAILDQAARLTRLRTEALARLDTLGQAIFHEMFGDGAKRIIVSLAEVISVRSSLDDPRKEENMLLPHVGPEHIGAGSGFIRWDEVRTCKEDGIISGKYHFDKGDILFSKIRPYLNKVAISDRQGMCSADMYAITVAPELATTDYVHFVLGSGMFLNYAATVSNRANIPKLNRGQLLAFECPLPSLQEQEQFSLKMFALKKQAAKGFQAATAAQTLFASLQHRAFRGEL